MPTFKKANKATTDLVLQILCDFESHKPLLDRKVRIDVLFAYGDRDEVTGELKGPAIKHHGVQALGICRKVSLKDRTKGMGDVEIVLDGDHWDNEATEKQQRAILDHELHHIFALDDNDDLGRPKIKLRKHDYQFGWFKIIAERHGEASVERQQARTMAEQSGQIFWPDLVK